MFLTGLSDAVLAIDALRELTQAFTIDAKAFIDLLANLVNTGLAMFEILAGLF